LRAARRREEQREFPDAFAGLRGGWLQARTLPPIDRRLSRGILMSWVKSFWLFEHRTHVR